MNQLAPINEFRSQLSKMDTEFLSVLPSHISPEKFQRVVITAAQKEPSLLQADRRSFMQSCMLCAQDGLLPDGKEAAFVVYKTKVKKGNKEEWIQKVQYIAMIAGIRKKVQNSDEIATWDARAVYANDHFKIILGDDERIEHEPNIENPGKLVAVYSIARLKNGEKSREWMTIQDVESIRERSKAKDTGPWRTDYAEMAKKTVLRRHSKSLPMSSELDKLITQDDDLYDLTPTAETKKKAIAGNLDAFASEPLELTAEEVQPDAAPIEPTGEDIIDAETVRAKFNEVWGKCKTTNELNKSWSEYEAQYKKKILPPAREDMENLYLEHSARISGE